MKDFCFYVLRINTVSKFEVKVPDFIKIKEDIKNNDYYSTMNICKHAFELNKEDENVIKITNLEPWESKENEILLL